jgi:hypothetical protein
MFVASLHVNTFSIFHVAQGLSSLSTASHLPLFIILVNLQNGCNSTSILGFAWTLSKHIAGYVHRME